MKTITLYTFLFLLLNSCASIKKMHKDIEFKIIDKSTIDNSFINFEISNKTKFNYYLPIIKSFENQKWFFILPFEEHSFFSILLVINNGNKNFSWKTDNCFAESIIDEEMEKLDEIWKQKKKSIDIKDLILLKSGQSVKIKVPINLYIKISKYCNWELENYRNEKELHIGINYPKKDRELATKFLSSKTLDNLKQMGYELYDKEINSNKVPLTLK